MANATSGEVEERMWCGHCCVKTPIRLEGNVKSCNWCGKVLADETGTAEEYNKLFLRFQTLQDYVYGYNKRRTRRIKKQQN